MSAMKMEVDLNFCQLKKHQNIRLIEYTLSNKRYSIDQVCAELKISERDFHFAKSALFILTPHKTQKLTNSEITDWYLTNDAFFNYLQYKEFEHSLLNAKRSNIFAMIAIMISVVSMVVTLVS